MPKDRGIQLNGTTKNGHPLALKIDVVRGADGKIVQGMVVGNTLEQNKALILITQQGENKFHPDMGVGLTDAILSTEYLEFRHKIRSEFEKDGMEVEKVELYDGKPIYIEAKYES